jgi:hypothetical protein
VVAEAGKRARCCEIKENSRNSRIISGGRVRACLSGRGLTYFNGSLMIIRRLRFVSLGI